ncbi:nodulation protein NfeD [Bacillus tianshenii]|nr:nodulation protein NfeD [Bacillus tianshenii]
MKWMRLVILPLLLVGLLSSILLTPANAQEKGLVYFVPFEKEVEKGLLQFMKRSFEEAEEAGADQIVIEMNTPGGAVPAATDIAKLMRETKIPITVFVNKNAISAGSYLALNADHIVMVPGATMGAAAIIDQQGNTAGKKAESYWRAEMKGAAEYSGRDPVYAIAMADPSVDLPKYDAPKGKLLTLTASQAKEVGYADAIVETRGEILDFLKMSGATIKETEVSLAEHIARFVTNPVVVPILLSIASLGLVVELYSPGFGIPGIMGASALVLFFYGHLVAGLAGMESIILLIAGIVLIIAELFVPGGIVGLAGVAAIIISLILSGNDVGYMAMAILIAFIVTVIGSVVLFKLLGYKKGIFRHIILSDSTSTDKGYVSNENRLELVGKVGKTITPLHPAGTALIEEDRIDVVTEGGFIAADQPIVVIKASGSRIIVREAKEEQL